MRRRPERRPAPASPRRRCRGTRGRAGAFGPSPPSRPRAAAVFRHLSMIEALIAVFLDGGSRMRLSRLLLFVAMTVVSAPALAGGPVVRAFSGDESVPFCERLLVPDGARERPRRRSVPRRRGRGAQGRDEGGRGASARGRDPDRGAGLRRAGASFPSSPPRPACGALARPPRCSRRPFHGERERFLRAGIPLAAMPRTAAPRHEHVHGEPQPRLRGLHPPALRGGRGRNADRHRRLRSRRRGSCSPAVSSGTASTRSPGGSDLGAWRRALASLKRLGPRVVYPGYGEPGTVALIDRMSEYLGELEEAVRPLAFRSDLSARESPPSGRASPELTGTGASPRSSTRASEPSTPAFAAFSPEESDALLLAAKGEAPPGPVEGRGSRWRAPRPPRRPPPVSGRRRAGSRGRPPFLSTASGRPG